jgi:protein SCO1/2
VKRRQLCGWLIALAALACSAIAFTVPAALRPQRQPPAFQATDVTGVQWGRDFRLTGHDGKPYRLADFRGKVVAVYFGFTRCPDVCPLTMATLGQAVHLLGDEGGRVKVVFITVDPKRDKPGVLAKYVHAFHEDFLGLYGDRKQTARSAAEFKVETGEHHSTPVFLLDPSGRLRLVVHAETSAESMAHDMRLLLKAAGT